MMKIRHLPALLGIAAGLVQPVWADELGRGQISSGSVMVSVCAGARSGGGSTPGDLGGWYAGLHECNASQSAVSGATVSGSASFTHPLVNVAVGQASATLGQLKLYADFEGNNQLGAGVWATGGWVDTLTVNAVNPGLQGQQAILSFSLRVKGNLVGQPTGNSGVGVQLYPYINDSFIGLPEALYYGQDFKVSGQGQGGFPYNATVDSVATFRALITLGTPFELGIFGRVTAGVASVGPNWISAATADFDDTITWEGIEGVTVLGNSVPVTISALSGTPWMGSYTTPVPEASTWALSLVGALTLLAFRRKARPEGLTPAGRTA
jgi:hypothetical protein